MCFIISNKYELSYWLDVRLVCGLLFCSNDIYAVMWLVVNNFIQDLGAKILHQKYMTTSVILRLLIFVFMWYE